MSISHERRVEAAGWAIETLVRLGHEDLIDELRIEWKGISAAEIEAAIAAGRSYDNSFTARLGDALYRREGSMARVSGFGGHSRPARGSRVVRVRFSVPLWDRATPKERYETVVHEICHIVCSHEAAVAGRKSPQAHGWEWKALMRKAGVKPERCHNIDRTGLKKSRKQVSASCGCGSHDVTPYVAGRIAAGCRYTCRKCKQAIVVHEKVAPVAKKGGGRRRRRGFRF